MCEDARGGILSERRAGARALKWEHVLLFLLLLGFDESQKVSVT